MPLRVSDSYIVRPCLRKKKIEDRLFDNFNFVLCSAGVRIWLEWLQGKHCSVLFFLLEAAHTERTIKELRPWLGSAHNMEQRSLGYQKGRDFPFRTLSLLKIKERPGGEQCPLHTDEEQASGMGP